MHDLADPATIDLLTSATRLHHDGALDQAAPLYERALSQAPDHAAGWFLAGALALRRGRLAEADRLLARALALRPTHPGTLATAAEVQLRLGDLPGAAALADRLLALQPDHAPGWFIRGTVRLRLGDEAAAAAALRHCLGLAPDHADAHQNLANALLGLDDPVSALRHARAACALAPDSAPAWAALGHILIRAGRWNAAMEACAEALRRDASLPEAHWTNGIAHLLAGNWAQGWAEYEWRRCHPAYRGDFRTLSTPPWRGELLTRLEVPAGSHLVSLQRGPRATEAALRPDIQDIGPALTDWAETAAALACLDLLITIDSAVAHCAGALGVPTWLLLPHVPDWRWLPDRTDTPWYESLQLFRQPSPGDWPSVLAAINALLDQGAKARNK